MSTTTAANPTPPIGSGSTFVEEFGPDGWDWWWIWIVITFGVVCAHLVTEGFSIALIGLILLTALMTHPVSKGIVSLRGWYIVLGVYSAIVLIVFLELYLGTIGVHYGPIGTPNRPYPNIDINIVDGLLWVYRNSDYLKAAGSAGASVILYFIVVNFVRNEVAAVLGHLAAALSIFLSVFFWLPFTESMEGKNIAFSTAAASASGAKKALGSYRERMADLRKEIAALDQLISVLNGPSQAEREKLVMLMRKYADLIKEANRKGLDHNSAARRQRQPIEYLEPLRPTTRYSIPSSPLFAPPAEGDVQDPSLTPLDIVNQQERLKEAQDAFADGQAAKLQRDQLLVTLRALVGDEVDKALKDDRSQVVSDEAIFGIMQTIAARTAAEAIAELEARIRELESELNRREQRNEVLRKNVDSYIDSRIENARNDSYCSTIVAELRTYLDSEDGRDLIRRVRVNGQRGQELLDPRRLPGTELDRPPSLDREINQPAIEREVQTQINNQNIQRPDFTWTTLREFLNSVDDSVSEPITKFAESACRRHQSFEEIKGRLNDIRAALPTTPAPKPPG
jgi:hypothetical protein